LNNILNAVPVPLRLTFPELTEKLLNEIKEEYLESGKQSSGNLEYKTVDFILKKPKRIINDEPKKYNVTRDGTLSAWHEEFLKNREYIEKNLHIGNPILCELIELWQNYRSGTLIDISVIKNNSESYRVSSFRSLILLQNEKCRNFLWNG
jgi:dynein heavy chain